MEFIKSLNISSLPVLIGAEIWHFPRLKSGFTKAKELIELYPKTSHGRVLLAEEISEAKGRFNRPWLASKGGLWCVITLYDELLPENHSLLSILFGLALVKTVRSFELPEVYIKWINDIHFNGRKLAGVLLQKHKDWLLAGLGLNVNNELPEFLPAINLKNLLEKELPLSLVLERLLFWLNYYYKTLWDYEKKTLEDINCVNPLIKDLKTYSDTLGRCLYYNYNLDSPEGGIFGIALNFTEKGTLILQTEEGLVEVASGEVLYLE